MRDRERGAVVLPVAAIGVAGGLGAAAALVAVALAAGRGAVAPLNASAHWLVGERAADPPGPAWPETAVGWPPISPPPPSGLRCCSAWSG